MSLSAGALLGTYEILALIGTGGMGEVYRARDTRLKRDVAIKVLPTAWAHDSDRLARFHREAELLATLNHPNIAAIYGFEESDGGKALVLELVEGPTLADRLMRPLTLREAVSTARQIAEALDAAHERGIVHRLERDGFRDLYAQRIDPARGVLVGQPLVVQHLHNPRFRWGSTPAGTAIADNAFVFNQVEMTGSIWLLDMSDGVGAGRGPRP